jgi:hypothetical protein
VGSSIERYYTTQAQAFFVPAKARIGGVNKKSRFPKSLAGESEVALKITFTESNVTGIGALTFDGTNTETGPDFV